MLSYEIFSSDENMMSMWCEPDECGPDGNAPCEPEIICDPDVYRDC